jgi:co-chaperonin GroES (HSP10)
MQSPIDKYIVQIEKKYNDQIGSLYIDTTYQPEWYATITGKVVSVPRSISQDRFKKDIVPEVQVGDEILFSYLVVFDRDFIKDPEAFTDISDGGAYEQEWRNVNKDKIKVQRFPDGTCAGVYTNKYGEILDGCTGDYKRVEKWLTGFKFNTHDTLHYCNMFLADQEYWMVDAAWVFARRPEGDTQWHMHGGYVMLAPLEKILPAEYRGLVIPESMRKTLVKEKAILVGIGTPQKGDPVLDVEQGDMVYIDYSRCEKYKLGDKNYLITTQRKLLGKE